MIEGCQLFSSTEAILAGQVLQLVVAQQRTTPNFWRWWRMPSGRTQ